MFSVTDAICCFFEMDSAEMLVPEIPSPVGVRFCFCLSSFFSFDFLFLLVVSLHHCNNLFENFIEVLKNLFSNYDLRI